MAPAVAALIAPLFGALKDALLFWREKQKEQHETEIAGMKNRQRLLLDSQSNNHEWEMRSLESTGYFLKWSSFAMFAGPVIVTVLSPEHGGEIWRNLALVPPDFMKIYYGITGAIWGIANLKDHGVTLAAVVGAFKKGEK